jgi:predicted  nucleic acid-binding Zn-ribbon protein
MMESENKETIVNDSQEYDLNTIFHTATTIFNKLTDEKTINKLQNTNLSSEIESLSNARELLNIFRTLKSDSNTKKVEELEETVNLIKTKIDGFDFELDNTSNQDHHIENDPEFINLSQQMEEMGKELTSIKQKLDRLNRRMY